MSGESAAGIVRSSRSGERGLSVEKKTRRKDALKAYEAPAIVELGSLHELTLELKMGRLCDLTCLHHGSISPRR